MHIYGKQREIDPYLEVVTCVGQDTRYNINTEHNTKSSVSAYQCNQ